MSDTDQIFMEELKQEFVETTAKNLVELRQLFKERNLEEIARIAHDIKGTSGIFGYDEGTEIARELNIAAKQNNLDLTEDLIDKLSGYMKEVGVV